jgi:hypothetical protein
VGPTHALLRYQGPYSYSTQYSMSNYLSNLSSLSSRSRVSIYNILALGSIYISIKLAYYNLLIINLRKIKP